ncbi:MAG: sulfur carrier protein ThiS adenylyltransferase ThiF [Bacteroidota bacterium]
MTNFASIKKYLSTKKIGIAGCGGLGSNCAVALARVGVGNLIIADFDSIEESNLNRQYFFYDQIGKPKATMLKENILRINPNINIEEHIKKLDSQDIIDIYSECDVIVEAFDRAEMKTMIIKTVLSNFPEKYIISGNGMAGWGKSEIIKPNYFDKLIICGDMESAVSEENPPLAPRVGMVSNMMANEILNILLKDLI